MKFSFIYAFFSAILFTACSEDSTSASDDTFDASVVCPADGMNAYGEPNRGTFTDARDGQMYKYTTIGNQVWMAENLKFDAPYSVCYERTEGFCDTFGRFYSLHENGKALGPFDQELLDTVCPLGWHVPSIDEWDVLVDEMGGTKKAGIRLKSSENFGERYKRGEDVCLFSALPAGEWLLDGSNPMENVSSVYWTSTAKSIDVAYSYLIAIDGTGPEMDKPKMSIRCIKD